MSFNLDEFRRMTGHISSPGHARVKRGTESAAVLDIRRLSDGREAQTLEEASGEVAQTILKQMGGLGRIKMMIGAKDFTASSDGVSFRWPSKQRSRGNAVKVTLLPSDTYKVEFFNGEKSVKVIDDVYAEDLKRIFEEQTGLYLSL